MNYFFLTLCSIFLFFDRFSTVSTDSIFHQLKVKKVIPKKVNFNEYVVSKGKLGSIELSMTISECNKALTPFTRVVRDAYDFGFDGGGISYVYSYEDQPVFALIPAYETDSIIAIAVLSDRIPFENKSYVGISVKELLEQNPKQQVYINLMMNWEELLLEKEQLVYIFNTSETNRIGKYAEIGEPGEAIFLSPKTDWVLLY